MLTKHLITATLIAHFSSADSPKPLHTSIYRLLLGITVALSLGIFLSKVIYKAILPYGFTNDLVFSLSLAVGFILGGLVSMVLSAVVRGGERLKGLEGILSTLSISRNNRWLASQTPMILVLGIVGLFGGILLFAVANVMLVSSFVSLSGWLLGLYSGYGCMLITPIWHRHINALVYVGIVILVGAMFDRLIAGNSTTYMQWILTLINLVLLVPLLGHIQQYRSGGKPKYVRESGQINQVIPNRLPGLLWYLVKLIRNKRTRNSLFIVLILSVSGALSILLKSRSFSDPSQILFFGAVLAAIFACDVRGITKRNYPPEIEVVSGVRGMVISELVSVIMLGLSIGIPMFIALVGGADGWMVFSLVFISVQVFASMAGLLASTLLVPGQRDAGAQFAAALLAIAGVFAVPRLCGFSENGYTYQVICWTAVALMVAIAVYGLEIIRRRGYGRS